MSPASTYIEPHEFTGIPKTRCSQCRKVVYQDEAEALLRAEQISMRQPMRAYLGSCGHWHVTRIRPLTRKEA